MNVDIAEIIHEFGVLISAAGVIVIAYWSYRGKERAAKAAEIAQVAADLAAHATTEIVIVKGEVHEVGNRIDGRLSELLRASTALARAEGVTAGEQAQRDRAAEPQP